MHPWVSPLTDDSNAPKGRDFGTIIAREERLCNGSESPQQHKQNGLQFLFANAKPPGVMERGFPKHRLAMGKKKSRR